LGIAVARAKLGPSLVGWEARRAAVGVHFDKVPTQISRVHFESHVTQLCRVELKGGDRQGAIQAARHVGDIHVKSELLVLEHEFHVRLIGRIHHVDARSDCGKATKNNAHTKKSVHIPVHIEYSARKDINGEAKRDNETAPSPPGMT
jgi:hypothetical protein